MRTSIAAAALLAALALSGCNMLAGVGAPVEVRLAEGAVDGATAALDPGMTAQAHLGEVSGVFVTFAEVGFVPAGDGDEIVFHPSVPEDEGSDDPAPVALQVNLLEYSGEDALTLTEGTLPPGEFEQLRLMITDACFTTGELPAPDDDAYPEDVCASDLDGVTVTPLFVPSGLQTGLKIDLDPALTIEADGAIAGDVVLHVTFDAEQSIVAAGATGAYLLKPVVHTCEWDDVSEACTVEASTAD